MAAQVRARCRPPLRRRGAGNARRGRGEPIRGRIGLRYGSGTRAAPSGTSPRRSSELTARPGRPSDLTSASHLRCDSRSSLRCGSRSACSRIVATRRARQAIGSSQTTRRPRSMMRWRSNGVASSRNTTSTLSFEATSASTDARRACRRRREGADELGSTATSRSLSGRAEARAREPKITSSEIGRPATAARTRCAKASISPSS
jgi:hypothetical protein